ncbi:MAG: substrate-binding domain-containing protein [Pseudomonadota bacterium]
MQRVTADQVAERAGVSRSAVSRTFTKDASVSARTAEKVLKAARELGYRPNAIASSLASGSSNIVALITISKPDFRRPYLIHHLNNALQKMGLVPYTICVDENYRGAETLAQIIQMPLNTAIVSADAVNASDIIPFCIHSPPIMLNSNFSQDERVDVVNVDDATGIQQMTSYLHNRNHKTVWLVTARRSSSAFHSRSVGLLEALARSDMKLIDKEEGDFSYESGQEAFDKLSSRGPLPDCLFCANDAMAMGAMDTARFVHGLSVPKDIRIIGFDDVPQASWPSYNLPTIKQSVVDTVDAIMEIIQLRVAKSSDESRITRTVPTSFIARE